MNTISSDETSKSGNRAVLTFITAQLLGEAADYMYIGGEQTDAGASRRLQQELAEEKNRRHALRVLRSAVARVRHKLLPLTEETTGEEETITDDRHEETKAYRIVLTQTDDFDLTRVERMERLIHDYLLYCIVYHWAAVTGSAQAEYWLAEREAALDELEALRFAGGIVKRPFYPF
ncbi:MAG: hypothetical protein LUC22_02735 [Prevotella sp.]|nr:hypothetical protein [Prevotella sp.]